MIKPTIALAMITKNEELHLDACLQTVHNWVDEIIILDSGSTDTTEEIARKYTDKFFVNTDWQGFGKQRQIAQSKISSDYVLWLDADERISESLKQEILNAIAENKPNTAYQINRLSSAFGKFIHHSDWTPDWLIRLYRIKDGSYDDSLVHEKVVLNKNIKTEKLKGLLLHYTYQDLHHYINKTTGYIKAWADEREGKRKSGLTTALVHAFAAFIKMYILKLGFLDGKHGFILAWLTMNSTFIKYIDLDLREYIKNK